MKTSMLSCDFSTSGQDHIIQQFGNIKFKKSENAEVLCMSLSKHDQSRDCVGCHIFVSFFSIFLQIKRKKYIKQALCISCEHSR